MDKEKYCPTQSATFTGYLPKWRLKDSKSWVPVPVRNIKSSVGIPYPKEFGGILSTICLYGYEQAKALAYTFEAIAKSNGEDIETKIVTFAINYDIKAKEMDENEK